MFPTILLSAREQRVELRILRKLSDHKSPCLQTEIPGILLLSSSYFLLAIESGQTVSISNSESTFDVD